MTNFKNTLLALLLLSIPSLLLAETAKLKSTIIKNAAIIVSKSNENGHNYRISKTGSYSGSYHSFTKKAPLKLNIMGNDVSVEKMGNSLVLVTEAKKYPLKERANYLSPLSFSLDKKNKYTLFFPYFYKSTTSHSIYYRGGMGVTGKVDNQTFTIYDDNTDGYFDAKDSILTDRNAITYCPIMNHIATKKGVYQMDITTSDDGESSIEYEKVESDMGEIKIFNTKRVSTNLCFVSKDASLSFLSTKNDTIKVIPGEYKLAYGVVRSANGAYAFISPSKSDPLKVDVGSTSVFKFGGPYKLGFKVTKGKGNFSISPSFTITGIAEEKYSPHVLLSAPIVSINGKGCGSFEYG